MSLCTDCKGGKAIYPGHPVPADWALIRLAERMSAPAVGFYACPTCIATVPRLAAAAADMARE